MIVAAAVYLYQSPDLICKSIIQNTSLPTAEVSHANVECTQTWRKALTSTTLKEKKKIAMSQKAGKANVLRIAIHSVCVCVCACVKDRLKDRHSPQGPFNAPYHHRSNIYRVSTEVESKKLKKGMIAAFKQRFTDLRWKYSNRENDARANAPTWNDARSYFRFCVYSAVIAVSVPWKK